MDDSIHAVLADLERQRQEIAKLMFGLRALYGIPDVTVTLPMPTRKIAPKGQHGAETVAGRVRAYLQAHPGPHLVADVAGALGIEPAKRVMDACCTLRAAGTIHRPSPRVYRFGPGPTASPTPAKPQPKPEPKRVLDRNGNGGSVLVKAHPSHNIYRDGSLLKCSRCKTVHIREDAFAEGCVG